MSSRTARPFVLIIRDGWGHNPYPNENEANAVYLAKTPVDEALKARYPHTLIRTSGCDVGLPEGVMGNSEVGHQNLGAGRVVAQELERINQAIRDGSFAGLPALQGVFEHLRRTGGNLHVLGLTSDGKVHSELGHAFAFVDLAAAKGLEPQRLVLHAITDGRDTPPHRGVEYLRRLEEHLAKAGVGRIATVQGRFYAMDRDLRWERVERAYTLLTGEAERISASAVEAVEHAYRHPSGPSRAGDEFIEPVRIVPPGTAAGEGRVCDGDAVIFLNFRGDRTRELTKAFVLPDAQWKAVAGGGFDRGRPLRDLYFATMTGYEAGLPVEVIFEKPPKLEGILGQHLSDLGIPQFRCAETEKYPHVTFFFNDYREEPFAGEDRHLVPSPRDVATYDQKPEMSAHEVTEEVLRRIEEERCGMVILNYANCDMVGHTGNLEAAIRAVETVDACVGRVVEAVLACGGGLLVTADHGNCERMRDPASGRPHTAHTTFEVDLILVDSRHLGAHLRPGGRLADVAPTALVLMGIPQPLEMTGGSLLVTEPAPADTSFSDAPSKSASEGA